MRVSSKDHFLGEIFLKAVFVREQPKNLAKDGAARVCVHGAEWLAGRERWWMEGREEADRRERLDGANAEEIGERQIERANDSKNADDKNEPTLRFGLVNAHQEEEARSHQELPFSRYLNKLTPPYGTLGFSLQSGYKPIWGPVSYAGHNYLYLQWSIDAYVYVVGAFPDENFATNGGAVYVALVHSGSARSGSTVGPLYEYRYTVTPTLTGLKPITQLPLSGTGVVQGDTTNYPIVFNQDMQMFRQNGTEAFTFPAQYENNIGLDDGIQIGGIQGSGVQWGTIMKSLPSSTLFPFGSFSLFRVDSIKSSISFECMVSIYKHQGDGSTTHITSQSKTIQVDIPLFNVAQNQRTSKL
ncbi:hypothetical protein ONZ45_g3530 [Pleurotus djamor]|nr:hypothetical protein ONZ45_g3530 [Pleurotus djamor]